MRMFEEPKLMIQDLMVADVIATSIEDEGNCPNETIVDRG